MSRRVKALLLFGLLSCLVAVTQAERFWRDNSEVGSGAGISQAALPAEARTTLNLILRGGPFPYARDGVIFGNYEKRLPLQPRGYYHEYMVITPDEHTRGARRIVCGPLPECYYTPDHYRSFQRIREQP